MEETRVRRSKSSREGSKGVSSTAYNRISSQAATRTRRFVLFLLGFWCGALLMTALTAPASFRAADDILRTKPEAVAKVYEEMGPELTRTTLRAPVAEANRKMFIVWGWLQFLLGMGVFGLLLFASNVGRVPLLVSGLMVAMAGLLNFAVIPRIANSTGGPEFEKLHAGFGVFQLGVVLLLVILVILLFQKRRDAADAPSNAAGDEIGAA